MDLCIHSPIWHNPDFYFNKQTKNKTLYFCRWSQHGITHLHHLFSDNKFISFKDLTSKYAIPKGELIYYLHIKEVIRKKKKNINYNTHQPSAFVTHLHLYPQKKKKNVCMYL